MQEVAVIQGLQAQVIELQVPVGLERGTQALQVVLQQAFIEQIVFHPLLDELREIVHIALRHVGLGDFAAQHFAHDGVQQQARRGVGVVRILFDQGARGKDGCLVDLFHRNAVIQVAHGFRDDRLGADVCAQAGTGRCDERLQAGQVQRHTLTAVDDMQLGGSRCVLLRLPGAFLGAALAIEHIGPGNFMVAAAHQAQFHLVLHVFNMEGAAAGARAHERAGHVLGQHIHHFAHAGRSSALRAVHGQEGLHHGDGDLLRLKWNDSAVATDDLVMRQHVGC